MTVDPLDYLAWWVAEFTAAIADTHPKGGDAKQAPSLMSGGGAATQQSHNTSPTTQSTD